jgi:hypothetical protein
MGWPSVGVRRMPMLVGTTRLYVKSFLSWIVTAMTLSIIFVSVFAIVHAGLYFSRPELFYKCSVGQSRIFCVLPLFSVLLGEFCRRSGVFADISQTGRGSD